MATVNVFVKGRSAMPSPEDAMIMCPVDETGRNSVRPSIIARRIACAVSIFHFLFSIPNL
jgi:hypothetical protein